MGQINIGLVEQGTRASWVGLLTHFQGKQVIIDKRVDNDTSHILLRSLLGDGYRKLLPRLFSSRLQLRDSSRLFPSWACQTLKVSETLSKCYSFIFVNSLTPFILEARLNCSQFPSVVCLSKQINLLAFF